MTVLVCGVIAVLAVDLLILAAVRGHAGSRHLTAGLVEVDGRIVRVDTGEVCSRADLGLNDRRSLAVRRRAGR